MDIKNQVCSSEDAKKLKELGVKQESLLYHRLNEKIKQGFNCDTIEGKMIWNISAFTVAELGEMLPNSIGKYVMTTMRMNKGTWVCGYYLSLIEVLYEIGDKIEANTRAKMLIWLIENKYITIEEVNKRILC